MSNIHVGGPSCSICNPPGCKLEIDKDDPLFKMLDAAVKKLQREDAVARIPSKALGNEETETVIS